MTIDDSTTTAPGRTRDRASGRIDLRKDASVLIAKTQLIRATCSWNSDTDYDLYGYLLTADGKSHPVATFGAKGEPSTTTYAVGDTEIRHLGDVGRGAKGLATETIEITLGADAVAFIPVAYSAQSNGTGSFHRYQVTTEIDNGAGDVVTIPADQASKDDGIFTLVPGIIYNHPDGILIQRLEKYSAGGEDRPKVTLGADGAAIVEMDAGPRNDYK